MRQRESLSDKLIQEIDLYIEKMEEIKELARKDLPVKDLAKRARNTLGNCDKKMEAIIKMAKT